jgi:hypothetical protein
MKFTARIDRAAAEAIQKKLADLPNALTKEDARQMGEDTVDEMKKSIAVGTSPIQGNGKFPAYKNPKKYPGGVKKRFPGKRERPVNLYLSGEFLDALISKVVKTRFGYGASVGYEGSKQNKKEQGHREGANGQPERPTIPQGGELFTTRIQKILRDAMLEAIDRIARRR